MTGSVRSRMWGLVTRLLFASGSFASIVGLLLQLEPLTQWRWWHFMLVALGALLLLGFVVTEFTQRNRYRVYRRSNSKAIGRYMRKWIEPGGRVAIWTRDLTWAARDDRSRAMLREKAKSGELILCVAEENELSRELGGVGAEVCFFGDLLELPACRFTITDFGRDGSAVAVGRTVGDRHVIEEFGAGDHPAYHMAMDLVTVIRKQQAQGAS